MSGSGNYTISGPGQLGASATLLTVTQVGSGTLAINSPISSGTGGFTKAGSGLVVLGAANSYTGITTVSGGTLQLGSGGSISSGNTLTTNGMGVFDINGTSGTFAAVSNGGTITNSGTVATLTIGNGSGGAGNWSGNMNLVWNETTGTNTISGNWSNSGNITLNATGTGSLALSGGVNNVGTITNSGSGARWDGDDQRRHRRQCCGRHREQHDFTPDSLRRQQLFRAGSTMPPLATVNINSATALGTSGGSLAIAAGTSINNTSGGVITLSNNNPQAWNGNFTFIGSNKLNLGTEAVTLGITRQVTVNASTLTIGGILGDGGLGRRPDQGRCRHAGFGRRKYLQREHLRHRRHAGSVQ